MKEVEGLKSTKMPLMSLKAISIQAVSLKKFLIDPRKRITAAQALEHEYFRIEPLPGRNALVPSQPGDKVVNYPTRPVDSNTDFEGTTTLQPPQPASGPVPGNMAGAHAVSNRNVPRPMPGVGMQRMQAQGMMTYNFPGQAGAAGGMNPANMPMQRGMPGQAHQQQQLRRKDRSRNGAAWIPSTAEVKTVMSI